MANPTGRAGWINRGQEDIPFLVGDDLFKMLHLYEKIFTYTTTIETVPNTGQVISDGIEVDVYPYIQFSDVIVDPIFYNSLNVETTHLWERVTQTETIEIVSGWIYLREVLHDFTFRVQGEFPDIVLDEDTITVIKIHDGLYCAKEHVENLLPQSVVTLFNKTNLIDRFIVAVSRRIDGYLSNLFKVIDERTGQLFASFPETPILVEEDIAVPLVLEEVYRYLKQINFQFSAPSRDIATRIDRGNATLGSIINGSISRIPGADRIGAFNIGSFIPR